MNLFKTLIHLNAFTSWSANAKRRSALSFSFNRSSCFSLTCNYAKHRAASYFLLIVPNPQCCDSLEKIRKGENRTCKLGSEQTLLGSVTRCIWPVFYISLIVLNTWPCYLCISAVLLLSNVCLDVEQSVWKLPNLPQVPCRWSFHLPTG